MNERRRFLRPVCATALLREGYRILLLSNRLSGDGDTYVSAGARFTLDPDGFVTFH